MRVSPESQAPIQFLTGSQNIEKVAQFNNYFF